MNSMDWAPYVPPYDPRRLEGTILQEDRHGRLVETADCGTRCPGCGLCCAGYRDVVEPDYAGVEEFLPNLKPGRGGLVPLETGVLYRVATCGPTCPGYGRCCRPLEQREHVASVADARRILLERTDASRHELEEALVGLAHEGTAEAVEVLEAYLLQAHARLEGFAECALEEGRYFARCPHNEAEAQRQLQEEVREVWENRCSDALGKIAEDLEPELKRLRYEMEIAQRILAKAPDEATRGNWETEVTVLQDLVAMTEVQLEEQQDEVAMCEAMIAEIEADLAPATL